MSRAVAARRKAPTLSLSVQYASNDADLPGRPQIRRWVRAALLSDATVTVRFVDAIEGRAINAEFRGKDYATNVLTFVYDDDHPRAGDVAGLERLEHGAVVGAGNDADVAAAVDVGRQALLLQPVTQRDVLGVAERR